MKTRIIVSSLVFGISLLAIPAFTHAAGAFYVDTDGDIGIGNTDPQSALDVSGSLYSRLNTVTDAASTTIDWNAGNVQAITLNTGTTDLNFENGQAGGVYNLILTQDSTGGRTVSWPDSVLWPGSVAPTLSTTTDSTDLINFVDTGSDYLGSSSLDYGAPAPTVYFSDDFNRADSGSTGNGWTDAVVGSDSLGVGISDNRQYSEAGESGSWLTYRTDISETSNVAITGEFSSANLSDGYYKTGILAAGGYSNPGYYITLSGMASTSNISVCDESGCLASGSFAFNNTDKYEYEWDITASPQNWSYLYVWDATTGSKPGTPTVSWTNSGTNFSPETSGDRSYFFNGLQGMSGPETMYTYLYKVTSL